MFFLKWSFAYLHALSQFVDKCQLFLAFFTAISKLNYAMHVPKNVNFWFRWKYFMCFGFWLNIKQNNMSICRFCIDSYIWRSWIISLRNSKVIQSNDAENIILLQIQRKFNMWCLNFWFFIQIFFFWKKSQWEEFVWNHSLGVSHVRLAINSTSNAKIRRERDREKAECAKIESSKCVLLLHG